MTQEQSRSGTWSALGAVVSAFAASICCVGPLVLLALGAGGAWASRLSVLEPYRPVFIAITFGFLGFAFYRAYRTPEGAACPPDGSCAVPRARRISRIVLWIVTPLILALLAFPYLAPRLFAATNPKAANDMGTNDPCCSPTMQPAVASAKDTNMRKNANPNLISLFEVPLVCSAAPQIGCGLRAKPILLELQRDPNIAGAWLNSAGTVLAVVGAEGSSRESRAKAVQAAAMAKDGSTVTELQGEARERQLKSFLSGDAWYRGAEVDALSKQEAGIIAARLVRRVQSKITLSDAKAKALRSAIAEASYRFVSGQVDVPQGDFMQKYGKELMDVAARAMLDQAEIAALKEAVAKGYRPGVNEK
jgi:mercuric ion transport protein